MWEHVAASVDKRCENGAGRLDVGVDGLGMGCSFCSIAFFFPLPWKKVFTYLKLATLMLCS